MFFHFTLNKNHSQLTATTSTDQPLVLLTPENFHNNPEHAELFNDLVSEYDRRLEEQVRQAKQDMLHELESQIQVSLYLPQCLHKSSAVTLFVI